MLVGYLGCSEPAATTCQCCTTKAWHQILPPPPQSQIQSVLLSTICPLSKLRPKEASVSDGRNEVLQPVAGRRSFSSLICAVASPLERIDQQVSLDLVLRHIPLEVVDVHERPLHLIQGFDLCAKQPWLIAGRCMLSLATR